MNLMLSHKKLANLIAVNLLLGSFLIYDPVKIVRYVLSLLLQLTALFFISTKPKSNPGRSTKAVGRYAYILFLIFTIFIVFNLIGADDTDIINRVLPLISMYGFYIFTDSRLNIEPKIISNTFVKLYIILALIVDIDSIIHIATGMSLWPPISWLGLRYCGPFGDPNFLALFSAVVFIYIIYSDKDDIPKKYYSLAILFVNILLTLSFSTFAYIPISILLYKYTRRFSNIKKQILFLVIYFTFISLYAALDKQIEKFVVEILYKILGSYDLAYLKYGSLQIRLDTQAEAMRIFVSEWWGQGPRQLVPQLEHDTHNSYVSMMFEQGIMGLLLILATLKGGCVTKRENIIGTYLMLSALLLNVHDTTIYSFFVLMQKRNN